MTDLPHVRVRETDRPGLYSDGSSDERVWRSRNAITFWALIAAVVAIPYYNVAHLLLGEPRIFGKALFLTMVTGLIVGAAVLNRRALFRAFGGRWFFVACVGTTIVLLARAILYDERMSDAFGARLTFIVLIYAGAFLPYMRSPARRTTLIRILLWACVVQALLGVIHSTFFPYIVTGMQLDDSGQAIYVLDPGEGGFRENGTLLNANAFASYLILGLLLLYASAGRVTWRRAIHVVPLAGLFLWGIVLSGSRYPILAAVGITAYYLARTTHKLVMPILLGAGLVAFLVSPVFDRIQERFANQGSGGRVEVSMLALGLVVDDATSALLGPPSRAVVAAHAPSGQAISDNSYVAMLLMYGVPFTLFLVCYVGIVWGNLVRVRGWVLVAVLFVLGQFLITNAIYWDGWLLYAGTTLLLLNELAPARKPALARISIGTGVSTPALPPTFG